MFTNKKCRRYAGMPGICAVFLGGLLLAAGWSHADDAALRGVLEMMPASAHISLAIPSFDAIETEVAAILDSDIIKASGAAAGFRLDEVAAALGKEAGVGEAKSIGEILDRLGVDPGAAGGLFARFSGNRVDFAGVFPLKSPETFEQKFVELMDTVFTGLPLAAAGDLQGHYSDSMRLGYAITENRVLLSSTRDLLEELAARLTEPATVAFGAGDYPGKGSRQMVLLARIQDILASGELDRDPDLAPLKTMLNYLDGFSDEAALTMSLEGKPFKMRLAMHDSTGAEMPALPALSLHKIFPKESAFMANLRVTPELFDFIRVVLEAQSGSAEQAQQQMAMASMVTGFLGDEAALAIPRLAGLLPMLNAAVKVKDMTQAMTMLGMAGVSPEPAFTHNDAPVHSARAMGALMVYVAPINDTLLAASDIEEIKALIDRFQSGADAGLVPPDTAARANQGMLFWDSGQMAKAMALVPAAFIPIPLNMEIGQLMLTVEQEGAWRQAALSLSDGLAPVAAMFLPALTANLGQSITTTGALHAMSQNNLKQMGLVCKMFANDSRGMVFPPMSAQPGRLMMEAAVISPEYLADPSILFIPGTAPDLAGASQVDMLNAVDDQAYLYISHAISNEEEGLAWIAAYKKAVEAGTSLSGDFATESGTIYRLQEGIGRAFIREEDGPPALAIVKADARIPVMMERPGAWEDGSINVLFFDGHVESVPPGTFPNTPAFIEALLSLDSLGE